MTNTQYFGCVVTSVAAQLDITEDTAKVMMSENSANSSEIMKGWQESIPVQAVATKIAARLNDELKPAVDAAKQFTYKDIEVSDILKNLYMFNDLGTTEEALKVFKPEQLREFVAELFDKGVLNDYLGLN